MGDIKNVIGAYRTEAFHSKHYYLALGIGIYITDTFKPRLHYLAKSVAIGRRTVYSLVIAKLMRPCVPVGYIFYYGKSNVGLQRQQLTVGIREREDVLTYKKAFVF